MARLVRDVPRRQWLVDGFAPKVGGPDISRHICSWLEPEPRGVFQELKIPDPTWELEVALRRVPGSFFLFRTKEALLVLDLDKQEVVWRFEQPNLTFSHDLGKGKLLFRAWSGVGALDDLVFCDVFAKKTVTLYAVERYWEFFLLSDIWLGGWQREQGHSGIFCEWNLLVPETRTPVLSLDGAVIVASELRHEDLLFALGPLHPSGLRRGVVEWIPGQVTVVWRWQIPGLALARRSKMIANGAVLVSRIETRVVFESAEQRSEFVCASTDRILPRFHALNEDTFFLASLGFFSVQQGCRVVRLSNPLIETGELESIRFHDLVFSVARFGPDTPGIWLKGINIYTGELVVRIPIPTRANDCGNGAGFRFETTQTTCILVDCIKHKYFKIL